MLLDGVDDEELLDDGVDELLDGEAALPLDDGSDELELDGLDDAPDGVEDMLLDEDGVDVSLGMDELADAPPLTPSALRVFESSSPDALMLFCCWNCLIAASVFGPILPSTLTSRPLAFNACWASRTSELPADCVEEAGVACADLSDACEALLSAASTAVLESANAAMTACASFMCVVLSGTGGRAARMYALPAR